VAGRSRRNTVALVGEWSNTAASRALNTVSALEKMHQRQRKKHSPEWLEMKKTLSATTVAQHGFAY